MSHTRNASEEIDFGMNEKMFVLFSAFVAIIIDFSAKVHQWYAKLWQRLEEFDYKSTVFLSNYNTLSGKTCFSWQKNVIFWHLNGILMKSCLMFPHCETLSCLSMMIIKLYEIIAHSITFCGFQKLKTLNLSLFLHIKNHRHHFSIV